jgi:hypothetical protein
MTPRLCPRERLLRVVGIHHHSKRPAGEPDAAHDVRVGLGSDIREGRMASERWGLRVLAFVAASFVFPLIAMALYEFGANGDATSPVFRLTLLSAIAVAALSTASALRAGAPQRRRLRVPRERAEEAYPKA